MIRELYPMSNCALFGVVNNLTGDSMKIKFLAIGAIAIFIAAMIGGSGCNTLPGESATKPKEIFIDGRPATTAVIAPVNMNNNPLTNVSEIVFTDGSSQSTAGVGDGASGGSADLISYSNTSYPALTNVDLALNSLLYAEPTVSLSGSAAKYNGQAVTNPVVTWIANKTMTARALSGIVVTNLGAGGSGSFTNSVVLDKDSSTKYSRIIVSDGTSSKTSTTTWTWTNLRYVGATSNTVWTNAQFLAMTTTTQAKGASGTATGLADQYLCIAYPSGLGSCTVFSISGFPAEASDWPVIVQSITNQYGYAENYLVYRSLNALNGSQAYDIH